MGFALRAIMYTSEGQSTLLLGQRTALHCQLELTALEAPLLAFRGNRVLDLGGSGEKEDKMVLYQTLNYYST